MSETGAVEGEKISVVRMKPVRSVAPRLLLFFKRLSRGAIVKTAVVIAAATTALFPLPAGFVERFYSNAFYPWLQSWMTPFTNLLPFALVDLLIIALIAGTPAWCAVRIRRAKRGQRLRAVGFLAANTVVVAAAIFLSFQLLWGFNYMRVPLTRKLEYDQQRITPQAEMDILRLTVDELNRESVAAHSNPQIDGLPLLDALEPPFDSTVRMLGRDRATAKAVPKKTLADRYLGATGIDGFTNPFGHEVLLNSDLLAFEKPFILAHEWAHLAGYADESEANFVAFLACARSDSPPVRYSGWLAFYTYLSPVRRAHSGEAGLAIPQLAPEVKADLRAMFERSQRRLSPSISRVQGEVYDRYLKANRVEAGIESYSLIVRLMLGARFGPDWAPLLRDP